MNWTITELNREAAEEILAWKYEPPYDFYENERSEEAVAELSGGEYRLVLDESGQIYGFFCTGSPPRSPSAMSLVSIRTIMSISDSA
ncbi:hypothetical protein ACPJHQ_06610 [Rossellomorea sp. H39__3]